MSEKVLTFNKTRQFQKEAERMEDELNDPKIFGVKCWYCDASLIENGSEVAFLGINPGGGEESQELDKRKGSLKLPYTQRKYNSWLDETWPGPKGRNHQEAVQKVFRTMFGTTEWETKLRGTACFNTVPLRSRNSSDLSKRAWTMGAQWSMKVLEHVSPKLILCNGNARSKSPWAAINDAFTLEDIQEVPIGAQGSTASMKSGVVNGGNLKGARVIGLPFLNRFAWPEVFQVLESMKPFDK